MGEKNKLKTDKLLKKFGKKKWLIDCEDRYIEDLLEILQAHGVKWFDEQPIKPRKAARELKYHKNYVFEIRRSNKQNYLQCNPQEYYPPFHYRTFTFNEFYDLYRPAKIDDTELLLCHIFDAEI